MSEVLWGRVGAVFTVTGRGTAVLIFDFLSEAQVRAGDWVRFEHSDGSSVRRQIAAVDEARIVRDGKPVPNIGLVFRKLSAGDALEGDSLFLAS